MQPIKITSLIATLLIFAALSTRAFAKPTVFVSIAPQKFFVEQICKNIIDIEVMVQPGANPVSYEPKPSQMIKLASSSAYLAIGVPFEQAWLGKFSKVNPKLQIIRTDRNIQKIAMAEHGHGEEDHHKHEILDPHIWLAPSLVKKQMEVILEVIKKISPNHAPAFTANYQIFMDEINALDLELKTLFKENKGMRFMVFHPSWGYFAREYGLEQIAIEMAGKEPKISQLREIIDHARKDDIKAILVQSQFSTKSAKVIAKELQAELISVDPLAEDWPANMRYLGKKLKKSLAVPSS